MLYNERIWGVDVYVTVERPLVRATPDQEYHPADFLVSTFKFHTEPAAIVGEYVRDAAGRVVQFASEAEAAKGGFDTARARINR
jgi:hypothetical protein